MEGKEKLNILILSWRGPKHPNAGGAEISTHEHAKGWVAKGFTVTLFTSYYKGAKREEIIDGVKILRYGSQVFGVHWEAFKWYTFSTHEKYDLVIDQFHGIPFFTPLYVKEKKLAFIHEVTKEVWRLNPWPVPFNLIPAITGSLFEPFIFKFFYKKILFMTVSNSTKQDLEQLGIPGNNVFIIHNGVSIPLTVNASKEKDTILIFLGAISRDKGVGSAIRLFSIINKKFNKVKLWLVGKGDQQYLEVLKRQIDNLDLTGKVKFFGYVNEEKKFELLKRAHLLINTSVREGWGIVVLEAAAMGTPAVAFDVPGLRDSIQDDMTGILSKEGKVEDLAYRVESLLNDQEEYIKLSKNAVIWSKKFTWEKSIKESILLIEKIIHSI